tara:strand:- start:36 stop:224 length:189 start_codon:yes stop_codon:yes gene_type:complete
MKKQQDLRKKHRLYNEYLNFLTWDSINENLFKDTDDDFYDWAMDFEIDSDWQDAIAARNGNG